MTARCTGLMLRSVDSGCQRRRSPLVCSLAGCCQGDRGSQKYTVMAVFLSMWAQRAVSLPWMLLCVSSRGLGEVLLVALGEVAVVVEASFEF